ncbi:FCD domain-containing protein [Kineococcus gypseus]|uniref:FCD domain-containing protein n=1 Tax=Kineococcus gypseus TaxID=1637102 RepID=UPI003D7E6634
MAAPLAGHLAGMRAARDDGDAWAFTAADRSFHAEVVRAAGNTLLSGLYDGLRDRQQRMGVSLVRGSRERMDATVQQHAELLAALGGDDREHWLELVREHVRDAGRRLRSAR